MSQSKKRTLETLSSELTYTMLVILNNEEDISTVQVSHKSREVARKFWKWITETFPINQRYVLMNHLAYHMEDDECECAQKFAEGIRALENKKLSKEELGSWED